MIPRLFFSQNQIPMKKVIYISEKRNLQAMYITMQTQPKRIKKLQIFNFARKFWAWLSRANKLNKQIIESTKTGMDTRTNEMYNLQEEVGKKTPFFKNYSEPTENINNRFTSDKV